MADLNIGQRAAQAVKQKLFEKQCRKYQEFESLMMDRANLYYWQRGGTPRAFALQQMMRNGYDVEWILTGQSNLVPQYPVPVGNYQTIGERAAQYVRRAAAENDTTYGKECRVLNVDIHCLVNWEKGDEPGGKKLASMAMRGYDIRWILLGEAK